MKLGRNTKKLKPRIFKEEKTMVLIQNKFDVIYEEDITNMEDKTKNIIKKLMIEPENNYGDFIEEMLLAYFKNNADELKYWTAWFNGEDMANFNQRNIRNNLTFISSYGILIKYL